MKRKGVVVRRGLKEAWSETATICEKTSPFAVDDVGNAGRTDQRVTVLRLHARRAILSVIQSLVCHHQSQRAFHSCRAEMMGSKSLGRERLEAESDCCRGFATFGGNLRFRTAAC